MLLQEYGSANQDAGVDLTSSGADSQLAQRIKLYRPATVGRVSLYLKRTGSPAGYLTVEIHNNSSSDMPTGSALDDGTSGAVLCGSLGTSYGWVNFDWPVNARPTLSEKVYRHLVLVSSSGYSYTNGTTEVIWGADQTNAFSVDGKGHTYSGSAWSAISTDTDFCYRIYSRTRSVYSQLSSIEALTRVHTSVGTYDTGTMPTIMEVMDFEEDVADEVDSWLAGGGFDTPLTNTEALAMIRAYANAGVAFLIEMTTAHSGFSGERATDTRAGAFRMMYHELRDGLKEGGEFLDALVALGLSRVSAGSLARGLTAGGWLEADQDDYTGSDYIQPFFTREKWDNP
jgi:hypothetical protein